MAQSMETYEDGRGNVPAILTVKNRNHWSYIIGHFSFVIGSHLDISFTLGDAKLRDFDSYQSSLKWTNEKCQMIYDQ